MRHTLLSSCWRANVNAMKMEMQSKYDRHRLLRRLHNRAVSEATQPAYVACNVILRGVTTAHIHTAVIETVK